MQNTAQPKRTGLVLGSVWLALTLVVLVIGFREAIFLSPTDAQQGDVGRIFYWHVPTAMLSLVFPYINLIASLAFLYYRRRNPLAALTADAWAIAAASSRSGSRPSMGAARAITRPAAGALTQPAVA